MKYYLLLPTKRVEMLETQIREQNERTALLMDVIGTKFEALNEKLDESYGNINKRFTELGTCTNCNVLIKQKLDANENLRKAFEDKMSLVNKLDEEIDKFQETLWKRITDFETAAARTLSLSHFADFEEIFEESVAYVKDLVTETKKKLESDDNEVDSDDWMGLVGMETRINISETRLEQILKRHSYLFDYASVFESIKLPLNEVVFDDDGMECCLWIVHYDEHGDKGIKHINGVNQLIVYFTGSASFRFELTCKVYTNSLRANIEVLDQKKPGTCRAANANVKKTFYRIFNVSGDISLSQSGYYRDGNIYIRTGLYRDS